MLHLCDDGSPVDNGQDHAMPRTCASANALINSAVAMALAFALALALATAPAAHAALGGDVASILRDHQQLRASHWVTPVTNYDIHEGRSPTGLYLREYVNRSGKEFAVSWQSPSAANISVLLGDYAGRYQAAAQAHRSGHHVLSIDTPELKMTVVRLPRGWQGLAILPDGVPAGVNQRELR
jgi:hypothetical protein